MVSEHVRDRVDVDSLTEHKGCIGVPETVKGHVLGVSDSSCFKPLIEVVLRH